MVIVPNLYPLLSQHLCWPHSHPLFPALPCGWVSNSTKDHRSKSWKGPWGSLIHVVEGTRGSESKHLSKDMPGRQFGAISGFQPITPTPELGRATQPSLGQPSSPASSQLRADSTQRSETEGRVSTSAQDRRPAGPGFCELHLVSLK